MIFEYDPIKSASNRNKHGIDFEEAQAIWERDPLILPSRFPDEPRKLAIGQLGKRVYTAIFTERDDKIRLISCRRASKEEIRIYEGN